MVLLNLDSGVYYGLDAIGTRAWHLWTQTKTTAEVCAIMVEEYDVSADVLARDLDALVDDLFEKQLLVAAESGL